ncbi:hypothetical protein ABIF21_004160 [Bradyrhizobium elkanii]|uniref:hypothetical protein n=1 Tax=Bradyrhizobium elkanii TaxID=29448 RepID=UPI0015C40A24|nr:hypothetical protein [Bradyrhizobium elkanii]NWL42605.1 hypothetical protein [Bradyrhizobium elkanii]
MTTLISKISDEWDKQKLRNFMENARRHSRSDIYEAAFRQLCRVEGRNIDDPLEAEFATVMRALEEALTEEAGKTRRLSRTRQKLGRAGVRKTLADLAMKPTPSLGFLKLVEFGMGDMSAESLVLKYRDQFEPITVEAAEKRLHTYGLLGAVKNQETSTSDL